MKGLISKDTDLPHWWASETKRIWLQKWVSWLADLAAHISSLSPLLVSQRKSWYSKSQFRYLLAVVIWPVSARLPPKFPLSGIENNTWERGDVFLQVFNLVSHSFEALTRELSSWHRKRDTMYYFVCYMHILLARRSRVYSRCHSFMALNRVSGVPAADWRSQTHVKKLALFFTRPDAVVEIPREQHKRLFLNLFLCFFSFFFFQVLLQPTTKTMALGHNSGWWRIIWNEAPCMTIFNWSRLTLSPCWKWLSP